MYPPLEQAYLSLREAFADLKHIIVTTDGLGEPGDFDGLAQKMAAAGITMTTVGVGSEPARPFLQSLADKAKGRAYFCPDAEHGAADSSRPIPAWSPSSASPKSRSSPRWFTPRRCSAGWTCRRPRRSWAMSRRRPGRRATSCWRARRASRSWPSGVMAAGPTAAFTSDIQSRWAGPWLNWPGFGKFWVQLVRQTMRHDLPKTFAACGRRRPTAACFSRSTRPTARAGSSIRRKQRWLFATRARAGGRLKKVPLRKRAGGRAAEVLLPAGRGPG